MTSKYDSADYEVEFMITFKRITPTKQCPMCLGNGTVANDYYRHALNSTCNECDGSGKVYTRTNVKEPTIPQALTNDLVVAWNIHNDFIKECPECNGEGEWDDAAPGDISFNTFKCKKCNGLGTIYEKTSNI